MGAEFVRGRVCQGPSLLGAEMSRNRLVSGVTKYRLKNNCTTFVSGIHPPFDLYIVKL